jgi:hypothetical protein
MDVCAQRGRAAVTAVLALIAAWSTHQAHRPWPAAVTTTLAGHVLWVYGGWCVQRYSQCTCAPTSDLLSPSPGPLGAPPPPPSRPHNPPPHPCPPSILRPVVDEGCLPYSIAPGRDSPDVQCRYRCTRPSAVYNRGRFSAVSLPDSIPNIQ